MALGTGGVRLVESKVVVAVAEKPLVPVLSVLEVFKTRIFSSFALLKNLTIPVST